MSPNHQIWKSNGKLLITGEYLVMEGAIALAFPLKFGQSLVVIKNNLGNIVWRAYNPEELWFTAKYDLSSLEILETDNIELASKLKNILSVAIDLSEDDFIGTTGCLVETRLDFNPAFGFGTSSTLISNIAAWAKIDPYVLLDATFGGSGYDIACANSKKPILFQKNDGKVVITEAEFNPTFKDYLYFMYLGNKQSSSMEIANFKQHCNYSAMDIDAISGITKELLESESISDFEDLIFEHESIISDILKRPTIKSLLFSDYEGAVKSLGAWGGDFVLVTSKEPQDEFRRIVRNKGYNTVFSFDQLVY